MVKKMTLENYKSEVERVQSDGRYNKRLKKWVLAWLLERFERDNGCLPDEMESTCHTQ
jgi:hypothetical protein